MAVITINADATQAARVAHAIGAELSLGRDATLGEVQNYLITYLKETVLRVEKREQATAPLNLTGT